MTTPHHVSVNGLAIGNDLPLAIIAGPCVMESRQHALETAHALADMARDLDVGLIYKTSFDKANRTSLEGARGIGLDAALPIFAEIREQAGLPVITDVHDAEQCARVAEVVDVLQIPAFLCRQTDLLVAAAKTGRAINVKKGQFLAPVGHGQRRRQDPRRRQRPGDGLRARRQLRLQHAGLRHAGAADHGADRLPGGVRRHPLGAAAGRQGHRSGGQREFAPVLARAAVAVGVAAVFMETHPDPDQAPSDGPNMIPMKQLPGVVEVLLELDRFAKAHPLEV